MDQISIHNLAVLRAAVEGAPTHTYFASLIALEHWVTSTAAHGLVTWDLTDSYKAQPTPAGTQLYQQLDLGSNPAGRAYLWPRALDLVNQAILLLKKV
jgi:hypothetical protein